RRRLAGAALPGSRVMGWAERANRDDKRYRECVAEIVGVLKKYDMAGAITVVSKERAMYKHHFPTGSVVSLVPGEVGDAGIRFRSKREDFPSAEAQRQAAELSAHIVMQMRDCAATTFGVMERIGKVLEEKLGMEHTPNVDFDPELEH